ncbi:hypothetical protein GYMLUDRAFT_248263 [Collybiopsis luxurians FD-317 M1]|uniref:Uncharacterized protein n=1 Tax=Collybiopsis luxurians FD-317 M1 TaxID=944289 RepID=A0A0D0C0I8_9AGAR|nr:hypothetical protein GYMLUDRAFT_248263 [Collybiopsis luxurians FD-317 M1]
MSRSPGFSLQLLRRKSSYMPVSMSDKTECSPDELNVSSNSEQNWQEQRRNGSTSEVQNAVLDSRDMDYIDQPDSTYNFKAIQQRWKRMKRDLQSHLPTGRRLGAWMAIVQASAVLLMNVVILI